MGVSKNRGTSKQDPNIRWSLFCDTHFPTTAQKAGFLYGLNMEIIWFPGNLEIWYDMISICPWLKISLNLVPCRDTQAAWRKQSGGLQTADFGSVSAGAPYVSHVFPYYFHIIFILFPYFPYCFHIISILFPYLLEKYENHIE